MGLVNDRFVVRDAQVVVAVPVEERVDDHAHHHVRRGVVVIDGVRLAQVVGEEGGVPVHLPVHGFGVRVQEQFVGIEAVAGVGVVGPVDAVAIFLAGLDLRDVAVPHVAVHFVEPEPGFPAVVIEEAQLHLFGVFAEQGKVRAGPVKSGAKRISRSGPDFHACSSSLFNGEGAE